MPAHLLPGRTAYASLLAQAQLDDDEEDDFLDYLCENLVRPEQALLETLEGLYHQWVKEMSASTTPS